MVKIKLTVLFSLLCFNYDLIRCEGTEHSVNVCVVKSSKIQLNVQYMLKNASCTCNQCIKTHYRSALFRYLKKNSSENEISHNSSVRMPEIDMSTMRSFNCCNINMTYLCCKMNNENPKEKEFEKFNESRYAVTSFELFNSSGRFCNDHTDGTNLCYTPERPYTVGMVNRSGKLIIIHCFVSLATVNAVKLVIQGDSGNIHFL